MVRGVIKYAAFLGVLIGIGIITKILEEVIESANIKGIPQLRDSSSTFESTLRHSHATVALMSNLAESLNRIEVRR